VDGWNPALAGQTGNANWNVWADLDGSDNLLTRYLRGDQVDQLFARTDSGTAYWELTVRQGSIRTVIDNSANVKDQITYDGWGNATQTNSTYGGRYLYTGREFDVETGLQYNRARYYDPATGRWLSQDPSGFAAADANLYRYVRNNPSRSVDPSGLFTVSQTLTGTNPAGTFKVNLSSFPLGRKNIFVSLLQTLWSAVHWMYTDVSQYNNAVGIDRWFGHGQLPTRLASIQGVFRTVKNAYEQRTLFFLYTTSTYALAWVNPFANRIRIGIRFWAQPTKREIGIIFHELTHDYAGTEDFGYFDASALTNPDSQLPTYHDEGGKNLGFLPLSELANNADTYEGFAEEYYL